MSSTTPDPSSSSSPAAATSNTMVGLFNRTFTAPFSSPNKGSPIKAPRSKSFGGATYERSKSYERHITGEGDRAVQQFMRVSATTRAIMAGNYLQIDDKDVEEVIRSWQSKGGTHTISELNYENMGFGNEDARLLAKLIKPSQVTNICVLRLTKNNLQGDSLKIILKALRSSATITHLDLSVNHIGDKEAKYVAKMLAQNNVLQYLDLSNNLITAAGGKDIAKALEGNTALRRLFIQRNNLMAKGGAAFAKMLELNRTIQHVDLGFNRLLLEGITALSKSLKRNRGLESLGVDLNEIGVEGAFTFSDALRVNMALTHVYMPRNNIGDKGVVWLSAALKDNSTVRYLDLEGNSIGSRGNTEGTEALAAMLRVNTTLRVLGLTANPIGDEGSLAIADALRVNTTLEKLILTNCNITLRGIESFSTCLKSNKSLQYLSLAENMHLGTEGHRLLADALRENHALKGLQLDYNVDDWQRLYNSIENSLARNHIRQRIKYATACRILFVARVLLNGRPLSYGRPSWESTRTERERASVRLRRSRNLADLPFEVHEAIFRAMDVEHLLTLAEVRHIAHFATKKDTLTAGVSRGAFLEITLGSYFATHDATADGADGLRKRLGDARRY